MIIDRALARLARTKHRVEKSRLWTSLEREVSVRTQNLDAVRKVHVGCGPHNRLEGWHNVDIKPFDSVDTAMDVTKLWPFSNLDYVYSEHFLEHLSLQDGARFLERAGVSLRPGGHIRISTPNLHWVMLTHFELGEAALEQRLSDTFKTNRAFHGWGHQFLYSEPMLRWLLEALGYQNVTVQDYGVSEDPVFQGLERHGGYSVEQGQPSVIIVEATRGQEPSRLTDELQARLRQDYQRFVDAS